DREFLVRGLGLIQSTADIESIALANSNGTPVLIRNVGSVQLGPEFRRGVLDKNGVNAVGGVVVIRYGANARQVIEGVKSKIASLESALPTGRRLGPFDGARE